MVMDLVLGGLVLVAAIRGWRKGFLGQVIRLAGLVAGVYLAAPLRDMAKPHVVSYLASVRPDVVDRLLWWVSATTAYFVLVGFASLALSRSKRQSALGIDDANRSDQFAGLGLGLTKGVITACFLVGALEKFGEPYLDKVPYGPEQSKESHAWDWNKRFHPASRIWHTKPVREFVRYVQKMGLNGPAGSEDADDRSEPDKPVQTASRTPKLSLTAEQISKLDTSKLNPDLAQAIQALQRELQALDPLK